MFCLELQATVENIFSFQPCLTLTESQKYQSVNFVAKLQFNKRWIQCLTLTQEQAGWIKTSFTVSVQIRALIKLDNKAREEPTDRQKQRTKRISRQKHRKVEEWMVCWNMQQTGAAAVTGTYTEAADEGNEGQVVQSVGWEGWEELRTNVEGCRLCYY